MTRTTLLASGTSRSAARESSGRIGHDDRKVRDPLQTRDGSLVRSRDAFSAAASKPTPPDMTLRFGRFRRQSTGIEAAAAEQLIETGGGRVGRVTSAPVKAYQHGRATAGGIPLRESVAEPADGDGPGRCEPAIREPSTLRSSIRFASQASASRSSGPIFEASSTRTCPRTGAWARSSASRASSTASRGTRVRTRPRARP